MERGMRPWYFASFVHRIWMNLRLFTVISLRDQGDRSKGKGELWEINLNKSIIYIYKQNCVTAIQFQIFEKILRG